MQPDEELASSLYVGCHSRAGALVVVASNGRAAHLQ
jgi:hypothetical protein